MRHRLRQLSSHPNASRIYQRQAAATSFRRKPASADPAVERGRRLSRDKRASHAALLRAFRSAPCMDCRRSFPWFVLEFDHRESEQKLALVPQMSGRVSLMRLLKEIEKCDMVCANCHRVRPYLRRQSSEG